jgi:hypothetical protein
VPKLEGQQTDAGSYNYDLSIFMIFDEAGRKNSPRDEIGHEKFIIANQSRTREIT